MSLSYLRLKLLLLQQLFLEVENHVVGHAPEVVLRVPTPLVAGAAVVHVVGPAVGDGLLDGLGLVDHFKVGVALLDDLVDGLGTEAHGGDVKAVAVHQLAGVGLHDVYHGLLGVRHVHHVHEGAFLQRADGLLALDGSVVDLYGVVRGAAGEGLVADEAREADRAGVDAEVI